MRTDKSLLGERFFGYTWLTPERKVCGRAKHTAMAAKSKEQRAKSKELRAKGEMKSEN
jgi:hypothetical protein